MVSEMCGYDITLICLKNRRCLTCHIYLKRTKEFDERLREPQIRKEIWKIVREEIEAVTKRRFVKVRHGFRWHEEKTVDVVMPKIKKRIQELLEEHEAILVYQP